MLLGRAPAGLDLGARKRWLPFVSSQRSGRPCGSLCRLASASPGQPAPVDVETHRDGTITFHFDVQREVTASASEAAAVAEAPSDAALARDAAPAADASAAEQLEHLLHHQTSANGDGGKGLPNGVIERIASAAAAATSDARLGTDAHAPTAEVHDAGDHSDCCCTSSGAATAAASSNGSSSGSSSEDEERLAAAQQGWGSLSSGSYDGGAIAVQRSLEHAEAKQQRREEEGGGAYAGRATAATSATPLDPRALDVPAADAVAVLRAYNACCKEYRLDDALYVIKECIRAQRGDVLRMLQHKWFLRPAAARKAVKHAFRFVQLLPRQYTDARTYNMVLTVCAEAGDLRNAFHCADMLQAAGFKMDTILYTNLIKGEPRRARQRRAASGGRRACASAGDADRAFSLYQEMREERVPACKQVFTTVVKACCEQIARRNTAADRRGQLVLLERAFGLVADMKALKVQTDTAVWNSLLAAAGRAGQLDRAFQVVEEMLAQGCRPNERTYWLLVDACAQAGDKELALRVYRKARREGCATGVYVYAAAVSACLRAKDGCDLEARPGRLRPLEHGTRAAMGVYSDLQLAHVEADARFYGLLLTLAGRAGDLQLVLQLQGEMEREGLPPCQVEEGGLKPDRYTFAAILSACCRANEAEIALDVARAMKQRGVPLDEVTAFLLLRCCYDRLHQSWAPGGYPPRHPAHHPSGEAAAAAAAHDSGLGPGQREALRRKLLGALVPRGHGADVRPAADVSWLAQAFGIYREAVGAGVKPTMRLLNQALMCLRVPWEEGGGGEPARGGGAGLDAAHLLGAPAPAPAPRACTQRQGKIGVESVYHVQAVSIAEEAIVSGLLPTFGLDSEAPLDLRGLPPAVAEVYMLTVVTALQRQVDRRRGPHPNRVTLLVPPYDPSLVFFPSYAAARRHHHPDAHGAHDARDAQGALDAGALRLPGRPAGAGASYDSDEERQSFAEADAAFAAAAAGPPAPGDARTGLGVAGVLRRLRLWGQELAEEGMIVLEGREITRWCKVTQSAIERRSASALPVQKPYGQAHAVRLAAQQRSIRMGF
eukprot:scaffold18.g2066.t1